MSQERKATPPSPTPDYGGAADFFGEPGGLEDIRVDPGARARDPAALLRRLGPPPPWSVPAQLRAVLEPVYRAASDAAGSLGASGGPRGRRRRG